jgi:hypothetical protein
MFEYLVRHEVEVLLHLFLLEAPADQPLHRVQGVLGVGDGLALGRCAAQNLSVLQVGDDRRRGARAFGIFDDLGLAALHDGDAGVGRSQVDADDLSHAVYLDE